MMLCMLLVMGQSAVIALKTQNEGPIGWATEGSGTTGGAGGEVVTVTSGGDLKSHAGSSSRKIIRVSGEIRTGISIGSNTTIEGAAPGAVIGSITIKGASNIILRNLVIKNSGSSDLIAVTQSHHIWIDHCELVDASDGILDMTHGCDFSTISWTKIYYTYTNKGHRYACLLSASDGHGGEDGGKVNISFHHNWWADNVTERMPRVRFGKVHVFNSYFASEGNNYCIRAAKSSKLLVENNYFDNVNDPHQFYKDPAAEMVARGNVYIGISETSKKETRGESFTPPYQYELEPGETVKETVMKGAGPFNKAEVVKAFHPAPSVAGQKAHLPGTKADGYDAAGRFHSTDKKPLPLFKAP